MKPESETKMNASGRNAIDIRTSYILLFAGVLTWGLFSLYGIDLVSEPFGSMLVMSRTVIMLTGLSAVYQFARRYESLARQTIRVGVRIDDTSTELTS